MTVVLACAIFVVTHALIATERIHTYGLVVTVFPLVIAWPYVWLRYFAFG
jgi:hypothetical protein